MTTTTDLTSVGSSDAEHSAQSATGDKRKFSRRNWIAWKIEVFWQIATALRFVILVIDNIEWFFALIFVKRCDYPYIMS